MPRLQKTLTTAWTHCARSAPSPEISSRPAISRRTEPSPRRGRSCSSLPGFRERLLCHLQESVFVGGEDLCSIPAQGDHLLPIRGEGRRIHRLRVALVGDEQLMALPIPE